MNPLINNEILKKIQHLKSQNRLDKAMDLCNELIVKYPDALLGYREKADVLCLQRNYVAAMYEREKLAELNSKEPADYYDLARLALALGDNKSCIKWADQCIYLSDSHGITYYFQSANFYKALALKNLNNFEEAMEACNFLDDDYGIFISKQGFVSKNDIVMSCRENIEKQKNKIRIWKFD